MDHKRDEANLMGQVAGIIAVMSAVVQALPPSTRKRLSQHLHKHFESLKTAMGTTEAAEAKAVRESTQWVRDLFLRQIDQATKKKKDSKSPHPARDELDIQL